MKLIPASHIRPICLIQVERTGKEQRGTRYIHSEDVREHLIKTVGIPKEQVAVKTSEKDELKEVDDIGGLMNPDCQIRFIITKQALAGGMGLRLCLRIGCPDKSCFKECLDATGGPDTPAAGGAKDQNPGTR